MKRTVTILALLLILAALGVGGFRHFQGRWPWEGLPRPEPALPAVTLPPVEPEPPVLSGDQVLAPEAVATLVGLERTVKAKRSADLSWEDAQKAMPLFENDAVRTFEKASASIAFGPDDLVEVDQNALVIIKPRSKSAGPEGEISLALLSGDLLDGLSAKPAPDQKQAIEAAAAGRQLTIRKVPGAAGRPEKTRVALKTLPDKSTSVAVLSGTLKIVPPKGPEIVLREKQVTRVGEDGIAARPRVLPGVPEIAFPRDGATYPFQSKVPRVEMQWKPAERARSYRVVIATDAAFRSIFADERVSGTSLLVRNLQPGAYYWRVRAQDADGFEGAYSAVRTVKAVYDDEPPRLAILSPAEMFVSPLPQVEIKGRTEQAARVKVNGQKADVGPDGVFTFPLTLKEGANLVTIEAIDAAGNSEYGKRIITYKGAKRTSAASAAPRP
jgi:hypothetical protein